MALLITLFLVLVNIFNNVTTNSPKAETLTAIEIWMLACILFVFGKWPSVLAQLYSNNFTNISSFKGSLIVYAAILNQKLINKSRKKEKSLKHHLKKKRRKDIEKETIKMSGEADRPFTMVNIENLQSVVFCIETISQSNQGCDRRGQIES